MNPHSSSSDSLYSKVVLFEGGLVISFELDLYERWLMHIRYVLGGLNFEDLFFEVVGKADEGWLDNHFEDDDCEDWRAMA